MLRTSGGGGNPSLGLDLTRFWGVEESEKKNKPSFFSAFTLAEMMVVMLILSIVLAAMAPVMTTRNKPNNSSPWQYQANNRSNAWFGAGSAQHAMIGQNSYGADDTLAKLLITVGDDTTNFLAFKRNNTNIGRLFIGGTNLLLGNLESGTLGDGSVGVGRNLQTGANSTAVGSSVNASGASSIAIGQSAYTSGVNTLVIGNNASIQNEYGRIPSREKDKPDGSVVIGAHASSVLYDGQTSKNVVVIGAGAKADAPLQRSGDGVIAIGENARAKQEGAIALGKGAEADGYYWNSSHNTGYASAIAIGTSAKSYRPRSIAIGNEATITSSELGDSIAIGTKATAASSDGSDIAIGTKSNANGNCSIALGAYANNSTSKETNYWNSSSDYSTVRDETFSAGKYSIAIGEQSYAKGSKAIAIGAYDGLSLGGTSGVKDFATYSGGSKSIAIGSPAQAVGSAGIAIGTGSRAVGANSIVIGANSATGAKNSVAIGYNVVNNRESVIQLGNSTDTVYIPGKLIVGQTSFFGANIQGQDLALGGHFGFSKGIGERGYIGTTDDGNIRMYQKGANYRAKAGYDGAFEFITTHSSDRRLKYVGKENTSGLDKIRQLKVFNYTFKKDTTKTPHVGVIAQDLQKVFPNAVKKGADGFLTIRMEDMFYAVINAIKELDAKYQAQEKRINELEKRIEKLEAKAK